MLRKSRKGKSYWWRAQSLRVSPWSLYKFQFRSNPASRDDILHAVKALEPLGSGFTIIPLGNKQFIRSIPKELNTDQSTVLEVLQISGYITVSMLQLNLNWEKARASTVIEDLVADSLVWVDAQVPETEYWSPQNL